MSHHPTASIPLSRSHGRQASSESVSQESYTAQHCLPTALLPTRNASAAANLLAHAQLHEEIFHWLQPSDLFSLRRVHKQSKEAVGAFAVSRLQRVFGQDMSFDTLTYAKWSTAPLTIRAPLVHIALQVDGILRLLQSSRNGIRVLHANLIAAPSRLAVFKACTALCGLIPEEVGYHVLQDATAIVSHRHFQAQWPTVYRLHRCWRWLVSGCRAQKHR